MLRGWLRATLNHTVKSGSPVPARPLGKFLGPAWHNLAE